MGRDTLLKVVTPEGGDAPAITDEQKASTKADETQTEAANISKLADSNIESQPAADEWRGNPRYFQTGKKEGQLKPSARVSGIDSEKAPTSETLKFSGLRTEDLKGKNTKINAATAVDPQREDIKQLKAKKKELSAEFSSKVVMRLLDAMVGIISKGSYGEGMNERQIKERMTYRDMLQVEWREYLLTLDVDLAPWAMVAVGSLDYLGAAFNTTGGKERVQSISEKIGGKVFGWLFSRGKK